jgi:PAS domain S-box-containing protein
VIRTVSVAGCRPRPSDIFNHLHRFRIISVAGKIAIQFAALGGRHMQKDVHRRSCAHDPLPRIGAIGLTVAVGIAYFFAAELSLALLAEPDGVALFWPAAGVSSGVLIAVGRDARLPVASGVMVATIVANLMGDRNVWSATIFALGNAGEAMLAAWLIERYFDFPFSLDKLRTVLGLLLVAVVATAASGIGGTVAVKLFHSPTAPIWTIWRHWFASDILGIIIVAPLIIGLAEAVREPPRRREIIEGVVTLLVLAVMTIVIVLLPPEPWKTVRPIALLYPMLVWLAARCRPGFAAAAVFIVSLTIIWTITFGTDPFRILAFPSGDRIVGAQAAILIVALGTDFLGALFAERRQHARVLAESQALLQEALAAGAVMAFECNLLTGLAQRSENGAQILGLGPKQTLTAEQFLARIHPDDRELFKAHHRRVHADSRAMVTFRFIRLDGREVWIEETSRVEFDPTGRPVRVKGLLRDVTRRKQAEELLRRQADLLDQSHDAIFAWTIGGGIAYWSRGAEALYGFTREEAVGRSSHELLQTRFRVSDREREAQIVQHGSWLGELTQTTRDGREITVESRHVRVSYGGETYALETNRDITARKRAEAELRKSEERFRSSVLHSPMPIMLFDNREEILAVSQSWLDESGYSSAELCRLEDWTDRAYGQRSAEVLKILRQIIATEPPARPSEGVIRTKDGRERLWSFVKSPLGAQSDGRRVFVTVAQDLTERKAHEEHVELLMREINHRAKNMLNLVLAIARQTVAREPEDFIQRFTDRIQALAANQDLLVRNEWQRVDMEDLVRAQLAHLADLVRSRIEVFGPKLRLNAAAAQAIGLTLHELATNAGKYGALSIDTGHVDVHWHSDKGTLTMSWTERDGPPVSPPQRRGFGNTVIVSMAKTAVDGEVQLDYAPSGLVWRLTCPAANALEPYEREQNSGKTENQTDAPRTTAKPRAENIAP